MKTGKTNLKILVISVIMIIAPMAIKAQDQAAKQKAAIPVKSSVPAVKSNPKINNGAVQSEQKKSPVDPYQSFLRELRKPKPDIKIIRDKIKIIPKDKIFSVDTSNINAFFNAVRSGNTDIISLLLVNGFSIGLTDAMEQTALHIAAKTNDYKVYRFLQLKGAGTSKKDSNGKFAYELFPSFTSWKNLKLYSNDIFKGYTTPDWPLEFKELSQFLIKQAKMFSLSSSMKGKFVQSADNVFVAKCTQEDGVPISTITANTIGGNFITFESDAMYTIDFKVILPVGSEIITNNLTLWSKQFMNCTILLLENGILEVPSDSSQVRPTENISSHAIISGEATSTANSQGSDKEKTPAVRSNSGSFTGTIDNVLVGLPGDKCRIIIKEYPDQMFNLSIQEAIDYGLLNKEDGVLKRVFSAGMKVRISLENSKVILLEKLDK
jgi:hypothetical protein